MTTPVNKLTSKHIRQIDREEERTRLTCEALEDVDQARVIDHQTVLNWAESLSTNKPLLIPK